MNQYLSQAKAINESLVAWRRHLHQNPEVGTELPNTVKFVKEQLVAMGCTPIDMAKCGIVVVIEGTKPGKTVLLRSDMDALPMLETSGLPFASCNSFGHTCGHDLHTATLLGTAKLLMENREQINGKVVLMFQPDEEGLSGARSMIDAGLLTTYKPDAAFAMHVMPGKLQTGKIAYISGPIMGSSDIFRINITGFGSHGASPHNSVDPINIACHIHTALQTVNAREINAQDPMILTIGHIQGGNAPNIIPQTAMMEGTIRTFNEEVRAKIKKRLVEIVSGIAATFGGNAEVDFMSGTACMVNDPVIGDEMIGHAAKIVGEENIVPLTRMMGSEDFAEIALRVPAVLLWIASGSPEEGYHYQGHNPKVTYNEDTLAIATAVYTQAAIGWLENNR